VRQRGFDFSTLANASLSWSRYFLLTVGCYFVARKCYACTFIDVTSNFEEDGIVFLRNIGIHP